MTAPTWKDEAEKVIAGYNGLERSPNPMQPVIIIPQHLSGADVSMYKSTIMDYFRKSGMRLPMFSDDDNPLVKTAMGVFPQTIGFDSKFRIERKMESGEWYPVYSMTQTDDGKTTLVSSDFVHRSDAEKALDEYQQDRPDNHYRMISIV